MVDRLGDEYFGVEESVDEVEVAQLKERLLGAINGVLTDEDLALLNAWGTSREEVSAYVLECLCHLGAPAPYPAFFPLGLFAFMAEQSPGQAKRTLEIAITLKLVLPADMLRGEEQYAVLSESRAAFRSLCTP